MKRIRGGAILGLLLALPLQAQTVRITPELDTVLQHSAAEQKVAVIVRFKERPEPQQFKGTDRAVRRGQIIAALREQNERSARPLHSFLRGKPAESVTPLWLINGVSLQLPAHLVAQLAQVPGVESVGLDATLSVSETVPASTAPAEWNLTLIGATELWQQGHRGEGVVVATLDTGADAAHPDLGPRWRGGSNSWFDPYGQYATPHDAHGHGTQVLGLMVGGDAGGSAIGVAPAAQWIAAKIFDNSGTATFSAIHQAYQWVLDPDGDPAVDDAPDVVNNSWGLSQAVNVCETEFETDIEMLRTADIAVVFSAGNAGPAAATSLSPANYAQSLSVGAVDAQLTVAGFSSRGPSACGGTLYPTLVAPGVNVRTSDLSFGGLIPDAYIDVAGTSFAVAQVAGGVALLKSSSPQANAAQIETALRNSAIDIGSIGPDNATGQGVMDLVAAQQQLAQTPAPQPGALQLAAENYSVAEGVGQITVLVYRVGGNSGVVSVDYATADGSASAGFDYVAAAGTLTFADGETVQSVALTILDDALVEANETLLLSLAQPTGGAELGWPFSAVITLVDDDVAAMAPVAVDDYAVVKARAKVNIAVLGNDYDTDGTLNVRSVKVVVPPSQKGNKVSVNNDGTITFTAAAKFTGSDQFQYSVQDNTGLVSNVATVRVDAAAK